MKSKIHTIKNNLHLIFVGILIISMLSASIYLGWEEEPCQIEGSTWVSCSYVEDGQHVVVIATEVHPAIRWTYESDEHSRLQRELAKTAGPYWPLEKRIEIVYRNPIKR